MLGHPWGPAGRHAGPGPAEGADERSNLLMRWRVVIQGITLLLFALLLARPAADDGFAGAGKRVATAGVLTGHGAPPYFAAGSP